MSVFDFLGQPALPRPEVSLDDAGRVAREIYGRPGTIRELGSNQDRNFVVEEGTRRAVLKFSNPAFGVDELTAQNLAADAVGAAGMSTPRCIPSLAGDDITSVEVGGVGLRVRLLTYVDGEPLTGAGRLDAAQVTALGDLSGRVAAALTPLEHPGAAQLTQWNLRIAGEVVDLLIEHVPVTRRAVVRSVTDGALAALAPLRDDLRSQVIHGDLTDDNAVLPDGVIDFGDIATSWTVAELAVTCASLLHHGPRDPLLVLEAIAAFHERVPLTDRELDALWPLVQLRAAVLVVSGEHQVTLDTGNDYADENRHHEWLAFEAAAGVDAAEMRELIGWRLRMLPAPFGPLGAPLLDASTATRIDLSSTSPLLDAGAWLEPDIEQRLLTGHSVTTWGEARLTRARTLRGRGAPTVALGVEVTVAEATEVRAPKRGFIRHAGDAVVLEGSGSHVWLTGLDGIAAEGPIEQGAVLGTLAPHPASLTVQLSRAPGDRPPAFVPPSRASFWKGLCPDPSPLLGLEPVPATPSPTDLLAERDSAFATVQEHYYSDPPRIERGWREHFVDTDAQTYLDMVNNVATTGHAHPRLVDAVARQWALVNSNSRFHYAAVAEFSRRLAALAPAAPGSTPLDTVFLVNSGSEAVDLAIRLATTATGRPTVIAMREAYHGWTVGSDAVSSSIGDNPRALETRPDWVRLIDPPHPLRGVDGAASLASLDAVLASAPPAAFLAEAVYGNAGGVLLPDGYLAAAYERVRAAGGLCIADEVQVGYGRLGEHFWGVDQQGVVPDILTIAKAMGNGHPLGAVITTRAIADAFAAEGSMFSSAGGSPVSCVVGMTVLDIMDDEGLVENARIVGGHLRSRLLSLDHPLIAAVHGMGLYLGVELMRDGVPAPTEAAAICEALLHRGVIVQPTGDHKNVLKIKPPMVIGRESVDYFIEQLDAVLGSL
jgi:4-aminobutyrate aminotransferase-like enzyme/Ser/Thr protein kinase RdoA (MazF antagonist)